VRGALAVAAIAIVAGCRGEARPAEAAPRVASAPPAAIGEPIYDLAIPLRDQDGAAVGLDVFRGAPVVIAMFYASCPAACPRLLDDIVAIERDLAPAARARLRVLLVSFDPARDTPDALGALATARGVDRTRWKLTSAAEGDARILAAVLGVKFRRLDSGEFFHTSPITVLDGDGRPVARVEGLGQGPGPLVAALDAMP